MTAAARTVPPRRGVCPGLSRPMPTGDGLLVRLIPSGTIPLPAFAEFCAAARRHGNGVIEITSRGSIQVRGLSDSSAPAFATDIAALGIAAGDSVPIVCSPLAGLDIDELFDAASLATEVRRALAQTPLTAQLNPKVSVAIDGGGQLNIAAVPADIRLCAQLMDGDGALHVGVGGDAAGAATVGAVSLADGLDAAVRLLDVIARRGRDTRARNILALEGVGVFRAAVAELLIPGNSPYAARGSGNSIGINQLRDGLLACGIELAFGHAEAGSLEQLAGAARAAGASGLRAAPNRVLLTVDVAPQSISDFLAAARQLGFVTRSDDPRRQVVACAGTPICASAHMASRAIAPGIADVVARYRDDAQTIHISGCAKGCAHGRPAVLTVVGTAAGCALVANGCARDAAFAVIGADELPDAVTHFLRENTDEAAHA